MGRSDGELSRAYRHTIRLYGKARAADLLWAATAYPMGRHRDVARDLRQINERARWVRPARAFVQIMDEAERQMDRAMKDRLPRRTAP